MTELIIIILVASVFIVALFFPAISKKLRELNRIKLLKNEFPDKYMQILNHEIPLYSRLPAAIQGNIRIFMHIFINEIDFIGQEGKIITDREKVIVAFYATLLIANMKTDIYPHLGHIIIVPNVMTDEWNSVALAGLSIGHNDQSMRRTGAVILAWDLVEEGMNNTRDGQNVVLHEFAHQLDTEDSKADGVPLLESDEDYIMWEKVMDRNYNLFKQNADSPKEPMDPYGATSPAEFFAVATETFFEKPRKLKNAHPDLYDLLRKYYKQNPVEY